jgi:hypothetical protein
MYNDISDISKDVKDALAKLQTHLKYYYIYLPTADNVEDTRPSGFSNDQLHVLKTFPTSSSNQSYARVTYEQRDGILVQNLNAAQAHIKKLEDSATDNYRRIWIAGGTDLEETLSEWIDYLENVMHDIILFSKLNLAMLSSDIDKKNREISQIQDKIGQLENHHDQAYIEAENKIKETTSDIYYYILKRLNNLKEYPGELISREMIKSMNSRRSETELRNLLQKRWKVFEDECNQKVNEDIQNCRNHILWLVRDLPNSSSYDDFKPVRNILGDVDFKKSGFRRSEKSVKFKAKEMVRRVVLGLAKAGIQTWLDIIDHSPIGMITSGIDRGMRMITGNGENTQEGR